MPRNESILCHYCGQEIGFFERMRMFLTNCINCKQPSPFHHDCYDKSGAVLQPRCQGQYVGHETGHTINIHDRKRCAHCKLAREFWSNWHCSPGVVELNRASIAERLHKLHPQPLDKPSPSSYIN